jgi:predicted nucleic acid-binding protein
MALVIDASGLLMAVLSDTPESERLRRRLVSEVSHAPHLIDAEIGRALRRQVKRGELAEPTGAGLLQWSATLVDHRHEMSGPIASAAWDMRHRLGFPDALYVVLAEALGLPLVTADRRLAVGAGCEVVLVGS